MGSVSQTLLLMIFIIIFMLLSLNSSTHNADAFSNAPESFNVHGLQQLHYSMMEKEDGIQNHIEKVSGEDDNDELKDSLVEKFRVLLGLRSFHMRRPSNDDYGYASSAPSPSPSGEAEAPAPAFSPASAPMRHVRVHPHPEKHGLSSGPPSHKIQRDDDGDDRGRVKRILIAVLVSAGAATLVCVVVLIWVCKNYRKDQKKPKRRTSVYGKTRGRSKCVSFKKSANKVSLNPGLDLFYLDSLGKDLEQQPQLSSCLKQIPETINTSLNHSIPNDVTYTLSEREESVQEPMKPEFDNISNSSTREIMSVHEDADSISQECACLTSPSGVKIVPIECHSSDDDESFHSLGDSNSSTVIRLSNASVGSFSDALENFNTNEWNKSCVVVESKASCSSTLPNLSSPEKLDSPGSNKTVQFNDLASSPGNPSKPSTSSSGIPPPPCPPPFFKANNKFSKAPPPPPSQLPQILALGKDGTPLPRLKPLHWDKVRAAPDRSMVWDKLRSSSFELDEEMIESLFGYNLQNSMKNDETKSKTPSPSKHVLEPKRLQNITILSKALNVTAEQVCEAILQGNGLSLQQLEALVKMVPTKEEEAKLSGYEGDITDLGSAEKFVKAMLNIPFAFQRVEAMLYKETFEDEVVHLKNSFSMLEEACKELRSSRLFLKLLEAVLKTGNRMNVGTIRGGARAFKLDALLKLADVKGTDGKTNLLHFVVQEIIRSEGMRVSDSIMGRINQKNKTRTTEEKEEDYRRMGLDLVSGLSTELYNVKKTAAIDLDVLASSVSNLSDGMSKLKTLIAEDSSSVEKGGNFINSMKSFLGFAEKSLKELQGDEDRVMSQVKEITEYFHGDVSKEEANPLRIFVIVRDFLCMLNHVCKELRSSKAQRSPNPLAPFK
ncbi:Formin, FH2 domain containing protein [Parasponia andersonii]|uniref:Formin-like protein n=1 Tax=Parasponia andersonii TaxID=3476 RepID=A0A2P5ASH7_PARAD|nr:Formin, FH2 domain containing protein [Parasponia andersonii]